VLFAYGSRMTPTPRAPLWFAFALVALCGACSGGGEDGLDGGGGAGGALGNVGYGGGPTGVGGFQHGGAWGSGSGGSCPPAPVLSCGPDACGDGVRTSCKTAAQPGGCATVPFTEACDGADFGGATCVSLGFGSGTLGCSATCGYDTNRCSECLPAPGVARCGPAPVSAAPYQATLAASDAEVALAWLQIDADDRPSLRFARLSPALDLISATKIDDDTVEGGRVIDLYGKGTQAYLSVAALPSGWLVAGWAEPELFIHAIDAAGHPVARTVIGHGDALLDQIGAPTLVSRPNAAPLLLWQTGNTLHVFPVAADGRSVSPQVDIELGDEYPNSAAFTGGSVYLASYAVSDDLPRTRVRRLAPDGGVLSTFDALVGLEQYGVALVDGAEDLRVVLSTKKDDAHPIVVMQRLSTTGASVGSPVELGAHPDYEDGKGVAIGGETISLLRGPGLGLARVGAAGALLTPAYPITVRVNEAPRWFAIVRRGPDAVAAWFGVSEEGLRVARLTP
jgi:hypothetical protein